MLLARRVPFAARALHTSAPRTMPLYIAYCPDYPDNLAVRNENRPAHLAEAAKDKEVGNSGERSAARCGREWEE